MGEIVRERERESEPALENRNEEKRWKKRERPPTQVSAYTLRLLSYERYNRKSSIVFSYTLFLCSIIIHARTHSAKIFTRSSWRSAVSTDPPSSPQKSSLSKHAFRRKQIRHKHTHAYMYERTKNLTYHKKNINSVRMMLLLQYTR